MYYLTGRIGTGSMADPFRPNLPDGASWSGHVCLDKMCLVTTTESIPGLATLTDTQIALGCQVRGLNLSDVLSWRR